MEIQSDSRDDKLFGVTKREMLHVLPEAFIENIARAGGRKTKIVPKKVINKNHHLKASTKRQIILINYFSPIRAHTREFGIAYRIDGIRDDYSVKFHQVPSTENNSKLKIHLFKSDQTLKRRREIYFPLMSKDVLIDDFERIVRMDH